MTDPIPTGLTFNAAGSDPSCVQNGVNILCNNFSLAAGQIRTVQVSFAVPNSMICGATIQNRASISSSVTDPNANNNQSVIISSTITCTQCSDGVDNDNDQATDYPADFSCSSATDNDETNVKAQCQDGIDNDGDGKTDYPADPGCVSKQDNSENPFNAQCGDGIDNDNDQAIDFPADFGCSSATDNDEGNPLAQCQDGIDNDGDGKIDFGTSASNDVGCVSKQDNDEFNVASADLRLSKTLAPSVALPVTRGSIISYTLVATNGGPDTATNVTIADPIPAGL